MTHRRRLGRFLTAVTAGALLLSACGQSGNEASKPSTPATTGSASGQTITYAGEQEFNSYNSIAVNNLVNSTAMQRVLLGFWYYGEKGVVTPDKEFGSYTKSSDSPLTVDYEFNAQGVWSDGNPIDCDDALLYWAAKSGKIKGFQVDGTTASSSSRPRRARRATRSSPSSTPSRSPTGRATAPAPPTCCRPTWRTRPRA